MMTSSRKALLLPRGRRDLRWTVPDMLALKKLKEWSVRAARLMVGIPDYQTYVDRRQATHPGQPVMTYEEFFVERQNARYAFGKGRFLGCC